MKNILFMHGGGPTAVINASLSGSIRELYDSAFDGDILYAPFGTGGLLKNKCQMSICIDNVLTQSVFIEKVHFPSSQYKQTYKYCCYIY